MTAKTKATATADVVAERPITGYRYIGNGAYFPGIPLRDLAAHDLVRFAAAIDEHRKAGTLTQLYAPVYEDEVNDNA